MKSKVLKISLGIALVLGLLFMPIKTLVQKQKISNHHDKVLNYIFELRLEHPYIVYAQAVLESNDFTSPIYKANNNMFGMKMPERRPTLAIGINRGHAVYRNWQECLTDYAIYQSSYKRGLTEEEYLKSLNSYASDTSYIHKIRVLKNKLQYDKE